MLRLWVLMAIMLAACESLPGSPRVKATDMIAYERTGSGDTTLIFVHGWACDRTYWDQQITALETDFQIIALDLPGHGETPVFGEDWSIDRFGSDVADLVNELALENVILVGHSMGGPIVVSAATKLEDVVIGVIGVDTLKSADAEPMRFIDAQELFDVPDQLFPERTNALVRNVLFAQNSPGDLVDWVAADMAAGNPFVAEQSGVGLMTYSASAGLLKLKQSGVPPLTLINADYNSTDHDALAKNYPNSEVVIVQNTSHFLMMERPATFNHKLRKTIRTMERELSEESEL